MRHLEKDAAAGRLKNRPLLLAEGSALASPYGREVVRRILPHREPMEFIDAIQAVDLRGETIEAVSLVPKDAPVFAGHFPGDPVYPGIYQIETMGQAALCLAYFVRRQSVQAPPGPEFVRCRFTKVQDAGFLRAIQAGASLTVRARVLYCDDLAGVMGGQILVDERICSYAVLEAHFL